MTAKPRMTYLRNEADEYVCPDCGITKKNQNTMHYHMKTHLGILPNTCQYCAKSFLQKQQLTTHLTTNAGKAGNTETDGTQYECPFEGCEFHSPDKGNCRTHCMRTHVAEETAALLERGEDITCKQCSNVFKSLGLFYYHSLKCVNLPATDARLPLLAQFR